MNSDDKDKLAGTVAAQELTLITKHCNMQYNANIQIQKHKNRKNDGQQWPKQYTLAGTAAAQELTLITKHCSTFTPTSQLSTGQKLRP